MVAERNIKKRVGVLVSGRGSNLKAILERASRDTDYPAEIVCVISNVPGVGALEHAKNYGIETLVIEQKNFSNRREFDVALLEALKARNVEVIVLAGFERVLTEVLIDAFPNRILNIHPALLPSFPGLHAQEKAWKYGVHISGCTAHIVDKGTDTGPIVMQAAVPVNPDDTAETLAERILEQEHKVFPEALAMICKGNSHWEGRRFHHEDYTSTQGVITSPQKKRQ